MTAADWQPVIQAIIAGIALILTTMIGIYVPRVVAAFEARTGVAVSDQERAAIMGAVTTAVGLLQGKLNAGLIRAADITPDSPTVAAEAAAALSRVPASAAAQGTSVSTAATMIAARVDTTPKPVVAKPA